MKMNKHIFIAMLLLITTAFCSTVIAQTYSVVVPYSCGFESSKQNSQWVLNPGNGGGCRDLWYIGASTSSEGDSCLYISDNGGVCHQYGASHNISVAYSRLSLPSGKYTLSFDWKANASTDCGLFLALIPADEIAPASVADSIIPDNIARYTLPLRLNDGTTVDRLSSSLSSSGLTWSQASASIDLPSEMDFYLTFVWRNDLNDTTDTTQASHMIALCIDNIQIYSSAPSALLDAIGGCDSIGLTWETMDSVLIEYRRSGYPTAAWKEAARLNGNSNSYTILDLDEGAYDVRICGIYPTDSTELSDVYILRSGVFVYCPDRHPINITNLTDNSSVHCYFGKTENSLAYSGVIDYGQDEKASRHTVCRIPKYDPRTGNNLRTIPDGECASVRLGNWDTGAQAEAIEFRHTVDARTGGVLLLKYAVVLENPDHEKAKQPSFSISLLEVDHPKRRPSLAIFISSIRSRYDHITISSFYAAKSRRMRKRRTIRITRK